MSEERKVDITSVKEMEGTVEQVREFLATMPGDAHVYALDSEDDWAPLDIHVIRLPDRETKALRTFVIMVPRPRSVS